jgi:hypothetical protein
MSGQSFRYYPEGSENEEGSESGAENTGDETDADSQGAEDKGSENKAEAKVDWESRYKELQAQTTRSSQEAAQLRQRIDAMEAAQRGGQADDEDLGLDDDFVSKKDVNKMISKAVQSALTSRDTQAADRYFRKTYPDLVKHEGVIAGLMRHPKDPEMLKGSFEDRIDAAAKEFNELTEEAKNTAKAEAEAAQKTAEEARRKASGLGSSSTTPSKGDDENLSPEEELRRESQAQKKKMNLL